MSAQRALSSSPGPAALAGVESMIEALPLVAFAVGLDDRILAANIAAEALIGPKARWARARFSALPVAVGLPRLRAAIQKTLATGRPSTVDVTASPSGFRERAIISVAPLRGAANELAAVLVAVLVAVRVAAADGGPDRGELARLREDEQRLRAQLARARQQAAEEVATLTEELRASNDELETANEVLRQRLADLETAQRAGIRKDRFLAMLAHELRNPLAPILTSLEIVRRRAGQDPVVHRAVQIAERQARNEARLIDDLLDVSRIMLGKIELRSEPIDLRAIVERVVDSTRDAAQTRAHQVTVALPDRALSVHGDPVRLEQVVANLLQNAVKYTMPGGRIWIEARADDGHAVVSVRDTGVGIHPEMLGRVFDLFTQAETSLARSEGGLGIGLTLVKSLVELHGGSVTARSDGAGRGSEFEIRLPALETEAPRAEPVKHAAATAAPRALRVLLIEDNRDAREALRTVLAIDGHHVREAGDASSGLRLAVEWAPDVAVVDIGLPGRDGYEVARDIRRKVGRSMRLVALTGYGDEESRERAIRAGFDAHMVKPITGDAVGRLLGSA